MPNMTHAAVKTYVSLAGEKDSTRRAALIERCWAADGRLVSPNGGLRGRAALAEMLTRFVADPAWLRIRLVALDVRGTMFRLRAFTDLRNGTSLEVFDAGEVDASGQITLLFTFAGPFVEAGALTVER